MFVLDGTYLAFRGTANVPIELAGDESLPRKTQSGRWSGDLLASFIGLVKGSLSLELGREYQISLDMDGVQRWRVDIEELKKAIAALDDKAKSEGRLVITEAISVSKISYHFSEGDVLSSGAAISGTDRSAKESFSGRRTSGGGAILEVEYGKPYYLFYRMSKISLLQGLDQPLVLIVPLEAPLSWTAELRP